MDCIFCKIIKKEIPATIVFENEHFLAFNDINPAAPVHVLFISKKHSENVGDMCANGEDVGALIKCMTEYAQSKGLDKSGYRIVTNVGEHGGQTVFHTHFHLLGGAPLRNFC